MGLHDYCHDLGYPMSSFPPIAGSYSGGLIIVAAAACVWDDLERFGCKITVSGGRVGKPGWDFMTVNKMVEQFPGTIEHCYSNEPQTLLRFIAARRPEYKREFPAPKHTHSISPGCEITWPFGGHGTSGLGSVLVGIALGYSRIVLAGMPLDDTGHNGEPPWRKCWFESSEAAGNVTTGWNSHWKKAATVCFEGKVRSLSGRTKTWLGDALEWSHLPARVAAAAAGTGQGDRARSL
jgi:hypothetical protein